jgi:hypothetical protein
MRIYAKKNNEVLAACDENLLGKRFEEGELVLDVKESFYKGELVEEEAFSGLLKAARNINLVGEHTIGVAKKMNLVDKVGRIENVPYAIILKV